MANNPFNINRTAFANFTLPTVTTATQSVSSGVYIPAGAIITGIRVNTSDAVTLNSCAQTIVPRVSTVAIGATTNLSLLPAQTVLKIIPVASTAGFALTAGGLLNVLIGSTNASSAITGSYDVYVDYLYCADHE